MTSTLTVLLLASTVAGSLSTAAESDSKAAKCSDSSSWHKKGTSWKTCAWVARYSPKRCAVRGKNKELARDACPVACNTCDTCDVASVQLADFEVWRREEGFWWGEYTFLGAEGDPYTSAAWPYEYSHYWGFIHLELVGNSLKQRNVFIYPPKKDCSADASVVGEGVCGVNGNERVFKADQSASDCNGNLAGPYVTPYMTIDTTTTIIGDDTVVYRVTLPEAYGGGFNQNQLTTLPGNGVRVRTAQGFSFGTEQPDYASFYREYKLAGKDEWLAKLEEIRAQNNILDSDKCAWVSGSPPESGVTCEEHFGFAV